MSDSNQHRRAEDSDRWKDFLGKKEDVKWDRAFETLGGHFTIRILLRREIFEEVSIWLEDPVNENHPDLSKIREDCKATRLHMNRLDSSEHALININKIIAKLNNMLGDFTSY